MSASIPWSGASSTRISTFCIRSRKRRGIAAHRLADQRCRTASVSFHAPARRRSSSLLLGGAALWAAGARGVPASCITGRVRARRSDRTLASDGKCGGRAGSACPTTPSSAPSAAPSAAASRRPRDCLRSRCPAGWPPAARADRPAGSECRARAPARHWRSCAHADHRFRGCPADASRHRHATSPSTSELTAHRADVEVLANASWSVVATRLVGRAGTRS